MSSENCLMDILFCSERSSSYFFHSKWNADPLEIPKQFTSNNSIEVCLAFRNTKKAEYAVDVNLCLLSIHAESAALTKWLMAYTTIKFIVFSIARSGSSMQIFAYANNKSITLLVIYYRYEFFSIEFASIAIWPNTLNSKKKKKNFTIINILLFHWLTMHELV